MYIQYRVYMKIHTYTYKYSCLNPVKWEQTTLCSAVLNKLVPLLLKGSSHGH